MRAGDYQSIVGVIPKEELAGGAMFPKPFIMAMTKMLKDAFLWHLTHKRLVFHYLQSSNFSVNLYDIVFYQNYVGLQLV